MVILSIAMLTTGSAKDRTPLTTLLLQLESPADVGCPESMALAHMLLSSHRCNSDAFGALAPCPSLSWQRCLLLLGAASERSITEQLIGQMRANQYSEFVNEFVRSAPSEKNSQI